MAIERTMEYMWNKKYWVLREQQAKGPADLYAYKIINDERIIKVDKLGKFRWRIDSLGKPEEIKNIKIMINDKLKNSIILNDNNIEEFKLTNFMKYD